MGNNQPSPDAYEFAQRLHTALDRIQECPSRNERGRGAWLHRWLRVSEVNANAWLNGKFKPVGERVKTIAARAGVSYDWLYFGRGNMTHSDANEAAPYLMGDRSGPSHAVRDGNLSIAFRLAAEALGRDLYLPPAQYAELGTLLFDLLNRGLSEADVLHIARRTAAALANRGRHESEGHSHQD
jgi:hypothetical protein